MEESRVASIDIGSNAMRLLVAERRDGKLHAIDSDRASVRLGAEVFDSGMLSDTTLDKAVEALKSFKSTIDRQGVTCFRAIGTSAMREAKNGAVFISRAEKEAGIKVEVIDGDEEARLVYLAVSETVTFSKGIDILVDIGGGSVEVTIVKSGVIIFSESVKMGTVRLIRLFGSGQISAKTFERLVSEYTNTIRTKIKERLGDQAVERCVGTGGNLETFLNLRQKFFGKTSSTLECSELEQILSKLQELTVEERISQLGLRADRADVVVPAAIVMLHVLRASQASTLLVPSVGVKEGVAYELLQGVKESDPHFTSSNLREGALELGRKYQFHESHAVNVSKLALSIFDQMKRFHSLSDEARKLLDLGALLHDIGHFVSSRGHHKHSFYLIESAALPGLTRKEKLVVACIARYHRNKFPQDNHPGYNELNSKEREIVAKLAAILRVADGLDRDNEQFVTAVNLSFGNEGAPNSPVVCTLNLEGKGDLLLDRWSVKLKSDLFESVYGYRVEIGVPGQRA